MENQDIRDYTYEVCKKLDEEFGFDMSDPPTTSRRGKLLEVYLLKTHNGYIEFGNINTPSHILRENLRKLLIDNDINAKLYLQP